MSYTIKHTGNGQFVAIFENGEIKETGPNIRGMVRYTYFENYSLPPIGWEVTMEEMLKDYQPKVLKDIQLGKIKAGKHDFGDTDWVEII